LKFLLDRFTIPLAGAEVPWALLGIGFRAGRKNTLAARRNAGLWIVIVLSAAVAPIIFERIAMKYTVMIYESESSFAMRNDPVKKQEYWGRWPQYRQALVEAGVFVGGAGLQSPATSTVLRSIDGKRHIQDGPFADSKEQLGGFFIIDVPNLDVALDWASRCPREPDDVIEVRPNLQITG
jgi:hypothetical protein